MTATGTQATPVVVTGLGVVSTLGTSADELGRRFSAGETATLAAGREEEGLRLSAIPSEAIPAEKRSRIGRLDRLSQVFLTAAHLAIDDAGLQITPAGAEHAGLSFGTGLGCLLTNAEYFQRVVARGPTSASPRLFAYTVSSAAAGEVSIALGIHGPNSTTHVGLAAGLGAVGYGFDWIQMGKADVVLAGGADVTGAALALGLRDMGLLKTSGQCAPFRDSVPGVLPSEGAVVVVLESLRHAQRRAAKQRARIAGYATGFEPTLTRAQAESIGVVATLRRSLANSGHDASEIDTVYCSAHGTPVDAVELDALAQVFGSGVSPLLVAPKTALGETFGASGVLALALATSRMEHGDSVPAGAGFLLADGMATAAGTQDLRAPSVAVLHGLCYSGNAAALVLTKT